jgi:eukaryotic-like serine/threonine-protein kinase
MAVRALGQPTLVGQTLRHYRIVDKIGAGGMGEIYRAHDEHLDREVAIKVLPPGTLGEDASRKRFRQEALVLSKLNHPNIAIVHDFDTQREVDFLVMEYIPGVTLSEKLAFGALPEKDVLRLGIQLAEGLSAAHERGVIHRDLKPSNLRLTVDGRLKILDFGLAKLRRPVTGTAITETRSQTDAIAGTLPYMAPELLLGENIDARSDIHAAGCVLYEMATGKRPFEEVERSHLIAAILRRGAQPATKVNPRISQELGWIIEKCLAKDPGDRYQSARELFVDLKRLSEGETLRHQGVPRQHPVTLRIFPAALVVLVLGLVVYFTFEHLHTSQPPAERVRVAILPFANKTGDQHLNQLGSVLTLTLLHDLGGAPTIRVLSYERLLEITQDLKAGDVASDELVRTVADYSNSQFVVTPTMFRVGDTFRVDAEIRDPRTGETLATPKFDRILSRSAEETIYSMIGQLGNAIQEQFRRQGRSARFQQRPELSRTSSVPAAFHWEEGMKAFAHGNFAQALTALNQAISEDPQFALAYAWTGRIYGILGYDDRALELSEKAAQLIVAPTPAIDAYFIEANLSERRYDYQSAENKYLELIRLYPDDPVWHDSLATVYEKEGKLQQAIASESAAISKDPQYITGYRNISTLFARVNEYSGAIENAQKAFDLSHAFASQEGEAEALCVLGTAFWEAGRTPEAEQNIRRALAIFENLRDESGMVRMYKSLGDIYAVEGVFDKAAHFYQEALARSHEVQNNRIVAVTLMNLGSIDQLQGKYGDAADHYRQSLAVSEKFRDDRRRAELLSNLGSLLINYGSEPAQGLKYVQQSLVLFEKSGDKSFQAFAKMLGGVYQCNAGRYSVALDEMQHAYALATTADAKSDVVRITYNLARCKFLQNQYGPARDSVQQSLDLARTLRTGFDIPRAEFLLGRIALRFGELRGAEAILTTAMRDALRNDYQTLLPDGYISLAELRYDQGRTEEAERNFRLAANSWRGDTPDPTSVEATIFLGSLEEQKGNISQAVSDCEAGLHQSLKMSRVSLVAQARLCLAHIQLQQNKFEETLQILGPMGSSDDAVLGSELLAQTCYLRSQALRGLGRIKEAGLAHGQSQEIIRTLLQQLPEDQQKLFAARHEFRDILR